MGLWNQAAAQYLDCVSLSNSFAAMDAALTEVIGTGVISGLDVINVGGGVTPVVQANAGLALAGHLVWVASVSNTCTLAAGTWDLYLCQPVFTISGGIPVAGSYPGTNGMDVGVLTAVATGTTPAQPGALLATVVSTGTAIGSVNNAPAGRNTIPGPAPTGTRHLYPAQANFTTQPNGTATAFTLTETPSPAGSLVVFKNGVLIDPTLYTLATDVVTFGTAPISSDKISAGMNY
jgi:hypothetical protein